MSIVIYVNEPMVRMYRPYFRSVSICSKRGCFPEWYPENPSIRAFVTYYFQKLFEIKSKNTIREFLTTSKSNAIGEGAKATKP